jgi:ABC-2 type transport system permease protein
LKVWEIFRFEVGYQLQRISAGVYLAGIFAITLMLASSFVDDALREGYDYNAPIMIAGATVLATMLALLVTAAVAGDAATRDMQSRMEPLVYTSPVRKAAYLGGRFLGAFAVVALLLLAVPVALLVSLKMPWLDPEIIGPFRPGAHLFAYAVFALPNAFICTALLFALTALSRRALAGYLGGAAMFLGAIFNDEYVGTALGKWELAKRLDPFGFLAIKTLKNSWTPLQRSTLPVPLDGSVLTNRLIWLGVALAVLGVVLIRFRLAHHAPADRFSLRARKRDDQGPPPGRRGRRHLFAHGRRLTREASVQPWATSAAGHAAPPEASRRFSSVGALKASAFTVPRVRGTFGRMTRVRQAITIALRSFREAAASPAAALVALLVLIVLIAAPEMLEVGLGTPGRATTGRLVMLADAFEVIGIAIAALTVWVAAQLVWRERDARLHDIADAAPVPDTVMFFGKLAGLALVLVAVQGVMTAVSMFVQISAGHDDLQPGLYLRAFFGLQLADYLLFAALAMVVQVVANHKYAGMTIALLAWLYAMYAGQLGVEHNLLVYGSDPGWTYSDMNGFGPFIAPWLWFKLYWGGWALLFAVVARLFWVRGQEQGVRARFELARRRFTRLTAVATAIAVGLIVFAGGFVFYNTNVLNDYRTNSEEVERQAEYERRYGRYETLSQPLVAATKLHVELHPSEGKAEIRGMYRLENRTGRAIDTVHLVTRPDVPPRNITFDRPARMTLADEDLGYRIYTLASPLRPGESLRLEFEVRFAPHGFPNHGVDTTVTTNGTYIEHSSEVPPGGRRWLPVIGYQPAGELDNAADRRKHGLPSRPAVRSLYDVAARQETAGGEKTEFEAVVGTDADQIAAAPGALRRSWSENGRRYFHYVADAPIRNMYAIFSARYAVHKTRWKDVDIEVLHHPGHAWNVERMAKAVAVSLDYHTRNFGPYPYRQVRLVEFPRTSGGGVRLTALPGMIIYTESFSFANPREDRRDIDYPFAILAHEVAHEWWGHQLVPAIVEGAPLLTESLAWYSAMNAVEETHGREHLERLVEVLRREYLKPRATAEVPLLRAVNRFEVYRTGPFAMYALRETIGEEKVNAALRTLLARFNSGEPPYPTSLDLYAQLRAVTPASTRYLLKDLFEEITFWDLRTKAVHTKPAAGGTYEVTLDLEAYKLKVGAASREKRVPMEDLIEIGVYGPSKDHWSLGETLYLRKHRIRSGAQSITVTVPRHPASAGIDPNFILLDRNREDNLKAMR